MAFLLWTPEPAPYFDCGNFGNFNSFVESFKSIPRQVVPDAMRLTSRHKKLPDIFFAQASLLLFSGRAMEILCRLAPGQLEGIPIRILRRDVASIAGEFFVVNFLCVRDSLIVDETTTWRMTDDLIGYRFDKLKVRGRASKHMWRERILTHGCFFLSNQAHDAIRKAGLRGPQYNFVEEVIDDVTPEKT